MNNLLDTHTLIWFINGDGLLSEKAKKSIEKTNIINFVSIASLWEIAIKISLGKLELSIPFSSLSDLLNSNAFQILPVSFDDTALIINLPFHHRDPFDRIIIAQSINNNLNVISKDSFFRDYQIALTW